MITNNPNPVFATPKTDRPQRKRARPDYFSPSIYATHDKKTMEKHTVTQESSEPWARIEQGQNGVVHTFSNGFQILESGSDFARVVTGAPVIIPEIQCETSIILEEIKERGFSVIRMMEQREAQSLSNELSSEYRELLKPNRAHFEKTSPDIDLDTVELTELPEALYGGRAGSGKLNSNGFTHAQAAWEIRKKVCQVFQKLYQPLFEKSVPVMTTGQFVLAWGPNLVNTLPKEERVPRFFPHIDYYGEHVSEITLMRPGVQSLVVVTPPDGGQDLTATLVFPRSHHYYGEICERKKNYPAPPKGGIPIALLVDMVNEGKILPPVRVFIPQGCALSWSRQLVHSPNSGAGKRVGMPVTVLPTEEVSLENRIRNVVFYLSHNPSLGVEADGEIRYHPLYSRRGSKIHDRLGWTKLHAVKKSFEDLAKARTGKKLHELGFDDYKKHFTPYEIACSIKDQEIARMLGVENPEAFKDLK